MLTKSYNLRGVPKSHRDDLKKKRRYKVNCFSDLFFVLGYVRCCSDQTISKKAAGAALAK